MYRQTVKAKVNVISGIAVVLAALAAALLGNTVFSMLYVKIGTAASLLFIIYGCLIALILLERYIKCFIYETDGNVLRVSRKYGRKERFLSDIWLTNVTAYGTPEEMKKRFPQARRERAFKPGCPFQKFAIVYKYEGRDTMMIFQPDETLTARLQERLKRK